MLPFLGLRTGRVLFRCRSSRIQNFLPHSCNVRNHCAVSSSCIPFYALYRLFPFKSSTLYWLFSGAIVQNIPSFQTAIFNMVGLWLHWLTGATIQFPSFLRLHFFQQFSKTCMFLLLKFRWGTNKFTLNNPKNSRCIVYLAPVDW